MALIREPKNVDLTIKSEPWTKEELIKFREVMKQQREKQAKIKARLTKERRTKPPMTNHKLLKQAGS